MVPERDIEGTVGSAAPRTPGGLPTYRGQDRRAPASWSSPRGRQFFLAVALLLTCAAVLAYLAATDPTPAGVDLRALNGALASACAVLAFVAGFISCLRWRMVGNASSLRTGAALLLLGVLITTVSLVPFVGATSTPDRFLVRVDAALLITVMALLAVAVIIPPINTGVAVRRLVVGVVVAVAMVFVVQFAVPVVEPFGRSSAPPITGAGDGAANGAVVAFWAFLGLISIARGLRRTSWLWTWLGVMLFGFAIAQGFSPFVTERDDLWSTGGLVVRLLALLFVLNGVSQELKLAYLDQRARLFDTRVSIEASEARRRVEDAEREERAHEARSALLGIQAATRTLAAGYDEYGTETQVELRAALEAEIDLLRRVVDRDRSDERRGPFDVARAVSPVVVCQRAMGRDVHADLGIGVRAIGQPAVLTEIVQTLLDNARDHAPNSPVVVRAAREGNHAVVRVEDRGPGVVPEHRDRIFRRGVSSSRGGRGLGLYIARRLLRDDGGDIRVEARDGGGASFVVSLPAVSLQLRKLGRTELVDQADHPRQLRDPDPLDAVGRDQ